MYGMMPRAKIVSGAVGRRRTDRRNRAAIPWFCSKKVFPAWPFRRRAWECARPAGRPNSMASVNRIRLRRSGMRKIFASFSTLHYCKTSTLPPALVIFSWADLENLCACTVMATVSSPSPRILTGCLVLDDSSLAQHFGRDRLAVKFSPSSGQPLQADDVEFLAEDVGEAALGHAAVQRHLAAFKAADHARTGARTLAFVSAGGRLAHAGAHAAADALALFRRLLRCSNVR
jgi:hypothetical protein